MRQPASRVAVLLLGSGFCALVYQVAWLRLLRLIFGSSTTASAAVLAIFMAGLGLGGLILGRRADREPRPLAFYARLELGIAAAAALSPFLVGLAQRIYLGLGGTASLGSVPGNTLRLLLAALVLGLPTFLMGGTLPAVARAVVRSSDTGRRSIAMLYGVNTLGAVCGALVTTFVALEMFGIRKTIWAASGLNLLVALLAFALAEKRTRSTGKHSAGKHLADEQPEARLTRSDILGGSPRTRFVLFAAAVVGFAFLLMELVWYRMLAPILGGSSYTFGLILAVALFGVGLGGLLYAVGRKSHRPTLAAFAGTCAAEALCVVLPYALGDRLAVTAMLLRPMGDVNFGLLVGSWLLLTSVVVLPTAIVAGYQFPLLVALLGRGRENVGSEVGLAYMWNTAGTILGSIVGGFGLLPLLSAPGTWVFVAATLLLLAAGAWVLDLRTDAAGEAADRQRRFWPAATGAVCLLMLLTAAGPSAVWRHSPIGAGGMPSSFAGPNDLKMMQQAVRRAIVWEREGRESSVAIHGLDEISLMLNGKADGSALRDAPTQVLSGLVGAALHPAPRQALVIGLGTGSSAGWLAEVESIEGVDVVELEEATLEVAKQCAAVNHDVLQHPKIRIHLGDGREHMLTSEAEYDLIFSEPSNPYRAGIASLFTTEFYRAAAGRLGEQGIFLQWLQSYHVDSQVVRTVLATLAEVFPHVESWQVHQGDMLLVASSQEIGHDIERLRRRIEREPFKSALSHTLGVSGIEGFYTAFVASAKLARAVHREEAGRFNTDDHPIIEFGFARGLGRDLEFNPGRLGSLASARGENLPPLSGGRVDWRRVLDLRSARNAKWGVTSTYPATGDDAFDHRVGARNAYVLGDLNVTLRRWLAQDQAPSAPMDRLMVAEARAEAADPEALTAADGLEHQSRNADAAAVRARYYAHTGRAREAANNLKSAFRWARDDPWTHRPTLERSLALSVDLARSDPELSGELFASLSEPFAVRLLDEARSRTRLSLALAGDFISLCRDALLPFEPFVPWEEEVLDFRARCYAATSHPKELEATVDLETFRRNAPPLLNTSVPFDNSLPLFPVFLAPDIVTPLPKNAAIPASASLVRYENSSGPAGRN